MRKKANNNFSVQTSIPITLKGPIYADNETPSNKFSYKSVPASIGQSIPKYDNINQPHIQTLDELYLRNHNYGKSGSQVDRLNDTINELASRRKKLQQNFKADYSKQNSVQPSSFNQSIRSDLSLPSLGSQSSVGREQSKLMEQIKRVQGKIKVMKDQRSGANMQRNQYQMIRPFIELQNQNMMYMQMMMLAQQNKGQGNQCCCNNRAIDERTQYAHKYHNTSSNSLQNSSRQLQEGYSQQSVEQNRQFNKRKTNKNTKKKYNFAKIRKFRVAVIAVYFYLLFPKYVNKFTRRRYKIHCDKYLNQKSTYSRQSISQDFVDEIIKLNTIKILRIVNQARADKEIRRVKNRPTAKLIISQQYDETKNFQFYIGDVELFLLQFLKAMQQMVEDGGFQNIIKIIGDGNMPYSFPIDNYHLLQEIYRISYHPNKIYLRINQDISKALIVCFLLVKLLAFDYFFQVKENLQWKMKILKYCGLKKDDMIQSQMAAIQMHISGILLHKYCMEIIAQLLQSAEGNIDKIDQKNVPIPRQRCTFQNFGQFQAALGGSNDSIQKQRNKEDKELLNKSRRNIFNIESYKNKKLYQYAFIENLDNFKRLLKEMQKNSNFEDEIKSTIMGMVDTVYQRLIIIRQGDYKTTKDSLLFEQKNILRDKINYSQMAMPKRNSNEKSYIKQIVQLIKLNRQQQMEASKSKIQQEDQDQEQQYYTESKVSDKKAKTSVKKLK